jgi:hypothetical protein
MFMSQSLIVRELRPIYLEVTKKTSDHLQHLYILVLILLVAKDLFNMLTNFLQLNHAAKFEVGFLSINPYLFLNGLCSIFLMTYLYLCIYRDQNQPINHQALFKTGLKYLPSIIIASFIYLLLTFVGTLAFVLPGVYLFIVLGLFIPGIIVDQLGGIRALLNSLRLLKSRFLDALITFALPGLVLAVLLPLAERAIDSFSIPMIYDIVEVLVMPIVFIWYTQLMFNYYQRIKQQESTS